MEETKNIVTAAVLIIGDEILSGRTQDKNLGYISNWLGRIGVEVREARVIPDVEETIVQAVNDFRARFTYVFTTGGIGPTHDDITADSVAKAFGVGISHHPDVVALFEDHYGGKENLNEARLRMARIPDRATLIDNPISKAPGFRLENVFVMAGIPVIVETMLESVRGDITGGPKVRSMTVSSELAEGQIAASLGEIDGRYSEVSIGSYPFYKGQRYGVSVVLRSAKPDDLEAAAHDVVQAVEALGAKADVVRQD